MREKFFYIKKNCRLFYCICLVYILYMFSLLYCNIKRRYYIKELRAAVRSQREMELISRLKG